MPTFGSRLDQYDVRVVVDNVNLGTWDKLTGGAIDSEETTFKPGNMGARVSLGGSVTMANVIVSKLYDLVTVHSQVHWLASRAGKGTVVITKQPLDIDGNAWGDPIVYRGKLKAVTPPEHDSTSNTEALLELEVTLAGNIG